MDLGGCDMIFLRFLIVNFYLFQQDETEDKWCLKKNPLIICYRTTTNYCKVFLSFFIILKSLYKQCKAMHMSFSF